MNFSHFAARAPQVRVLVVGDLMLDAWVSGLVTRMSPEAPVPVVAVSERHVSAGGAANVAANVKSLGASVVIGGVTGADPSATLLRDKLRASGIGTDALVEDGNRRTTVKTRVTAGGRQIVRFDEEDRDGLHAEIEDILRESCAAVLKRADACVISDYAKGVVTDSFAAWLIGESTKAGKPVVVDPKSRNLARYRGATVITPNLKEASEAAAGLSYADLASLVLPSSLLVTRGDEGMTLFESGREARHIPAIPAEVADVTGAGDTVVATLAIALGAGMEQADAAALANLAAGIAVRHAGCHAVTLEELGRESDAG